MSRIWKQAMRHWRAIGVCLLALLPVAGVVSSASLSAGKPFPGIALVTNGPSILLSWDPQEPIGRVLDTVSNLELIADYDTPAGRVRGEKVASARLQRGATSVQFDLPKQLNNAPMGSVCLRFRHNMNHSLPLRMPAEGVSSDGFRHLAWEPVVTAGAYSGSLKTQMTQIDANLARLGEDEAAFSEWKAERGLAVASDCEEIKMLSPPRPATAIIGAAQIVAADEDCVTKFAELVGSPSVAAARIIEFLKAERTRLAKHGDTSGVRALDAKLLKANALSAAIARHGAIKRKHLAGDLPLTSSVWELMSAPDAKFNLAMALGLLDGFELCVSNGREQFQLSYDKWIEESRPNLIAANKEIMRDTCRSRFNEGQERGQALQMLKTQREEAGKMLAGQTIPDLPVTKIKSILSEGC